MTVGGPVEIVGAAPFVPVGLRALAEEAADAGIRNVAMLIDRWIDGSERFDAPGEALLVALADGAVVGVGGLSRCPDVGGAMRVRRFYVAEGWRRHGVGRAIAERLVEQGLASAATVTCNARASAAAPLFWASMGFRPTDTPGITHVLTR